MAVLIFSSPVSAQERTDTIVPPQTDDRCRFEAKELILPGALIAVGASSFFFSPMRDFDHSVKKEMVNLRGNHHRIKLDEYTRFVPTAINVTLALSGKQSKYTIKERLLIKVTSAATMYVLTQGIKHTVSRTRPDGSDEHSFPSGHVATVFLGAESLRLNYGNLWGAAGYTAATATAFLRLYNNRHWFSDVVTAAGIGILSAHVGYWLLPIEKNILGIDDTKQDNIAFAAAPIYDTVYRAPGLAVSIQF